MDDLLAEIRTTAGSDERVLVTTLTKRMAEDLTEYLDENGVRVRYLHSDIDTVERMEIIRDLRLGEFDVLVGINLLREGFDMPEVSIVAILDADKEGFLRAERSLIQTIGRAARNANGRAILYADKVTRSMERAIEVTELRREKQITHNIENSITPKTIKKEVSDVMEGARTGSESRVAEKNLKSLISSRNGIPQDPKALAKLLDQLELDMFEHAKNLEFEEAATVRDQISKIRQSRFGA